MTEELEQLLKNLKLKRMLNVYDEQLRAAPKAEPRAAQTPRSIAQSPAATGRRINGSYNQKSLASHGSARGGSNITSLFPQADDSER